MGSDIQGGAQHFAAVNSGCGFVSYYKEVFGSPNIKKRYIIKGGPGTGKSSLMRQVASAALRRGREVVFYRCSSDPDSLDGIIIDGRVAFLDGTAPHVYEPQLAGAEDEIINLGEFWDAEGLYRSYNEIAALSALKSGAYARAYRFLSAAMNVEENNRALALPALKRSKLLGAAERLMRAMPRGKGFELSYGFVNAIGMKGRCHLDTYERLAQRTYAIYDSYGLGTELLAAIIDIARDKELKIKVSYMPLMPSLPDAVFIEDTDTAFVLCRDSELSDSARVNMKRFVDGEAVEGIRSEYRFNLRLCDALMTSASNALEAAGEYHFKLEKIYTSCMDFKAQERFIRELCDKII